MKDHLAVMKGHRAVMVSHLAAAQTRFVVLEVRSPCARHAVALRWSFVSLSIGIDL